MFSTHREIFENIFCKKLKFSRMARTRSSDSDGGPLYFIDDNKGRSRPPERKPEKVEKVNPGLGMPGVNPLTPSKYSDQRENEELRGHLKMARDLIDRLHAEGASAKAG